MARYDGKVLLLGYSGTAAKSFGLRIGEGVVGVVGESTGSQAGQPGPVALPEGSQALKPTCVGEGEGIGYKDVGEEGERSGDQVVRRGGNREEE